MQPKRVLIADDDPALTTALRLRCKSMGFEVETASTGIEVISRVQECPPDLLILDVAMPAGDGLSVCEMLAGDTNLDPIPVIMLTGRSDADTIRRCESLGAHYVMKEPNAWETLRPIINALLEGETTSEPFAEARQKREDSPLDHPQQPTVLSVDDAPDISHALRLRLGVHGVHVLRAFNGMQGYWMALKEHPDVIITDFTMPEGRGNTLLGRLKSHPQTRNIPVIILTGRTVAGGKDHALERDLLRLGASKFFTKPLDFEALLLELGKYIPIQQPTAAT